MSADYKRHDPRGWGGNPSRGAALGRAVYQDAPKDRPIKLYLRRVRLDSGGYDPNGTYFGHGSPLYWVSGEDAEGNEVDYMLRAYDREDAKAEVRTTYPGARFYR